MNKDPINPSYIIIVNLVDNRRAKISLKNTGNERFDKKNFNNYRPISILPNFSNISEKIVFDQFYNYYYLLNLSNPSQFGFRKKVSTSNALINTFQYIYDHLD